VRDIRSACGSSSSGVLTVGLEVEIEFLFEVNGSGRSSKSDWDPRNMLIRVRSARLRVCLCVGFIGDGEAVAIDDSISSAMASESGLSDDGGNDNRGTGLGGGGMEGIDACSLSSWRALELLKTCFSSLGSLLRLLENLSKGEL